MVIVEFDHPDFFPRMIVSWETDIALLGGQELTIQLKDHIPFPSTQLSHNFVSILGPNKESCHLKAHSQLVFPLVLYEICFTQILH